MILYCLCNYCITTIYYADNICSCFKREGEREIMTFKVIGYKVR